MGGLGFGRPGVVGGAECILEVTLKAADKFESFALGRRLVLPLLLGFDLLLLAFGATWTRV